MLCTDLIDPRHFFHGTVYNMVLSGGSINNKSSEPDNTMLCQEIDESTNAIYVNLSTATGDEISLHQPTESAYVNLSTATGDKTSLYQPNEFETLDSLNQSTKKVKEVSYKDLQ